MSEKTNTVVGATGGIGSMLLPAREAGFEVRGNIEWRTDDYFAEDRGHNNTFRRNFPGVPFRPRLQDFSWEEIRRMENPSLIVGHPDCGQFSALSGTNKFLSHDHHMNVKDIPATVKIIQRLAPRLFALDNLPASLKAYPLARYAAELPDYDLFPEFVWNGGYFNVQKHRNRFFLIGSRKEEGWAFTPGEVEPVGLSLESVIGDLPNPDELPPGGNVPPNHDPIDLGGRATNLYDMRYIGDRPTWGEVRDYAREHWPPGTTLTYRGKDGSLKKKPGCRVEFWDERGASTLDGGSYKLSPTRFTPLTIRERARIQEFPDSFVFFGTKLDSTGAWNPSTSPTVIRQTGKCIPLGFTRFLAKQIAAHIDGEPFEASGARLLKPNEHIDRAKMQFCQTVGYSNQEGACAACWLRDRCPIRAKTYAVGGA
jgi:site-specific DNA-cytosine methylase